MRSARKFGQGMVVMVALWSVAANALAVAAIAYLLAPEAYREELLNEVSSWLPAGDAGPVKSSLNISYVEKFDPEASEAERKRSLNFTLVSKAAEEIAAGAESDELEQDTAQADDAALESGVHEEVKAMAIEPVLKSSMKQGRPEIGRFDPVTVSGNSDSCVEVGRMMLEEARAPTNLLHVMVETEAITIAKICTSNGAVFLTCRANQITVSPRKPRPDNGC